MEYIQLKGWSALQRKITEKKLGRYDQRLTRMSDPPNIEMVLDRNRIGKHQVVLYETDIWQDGGQYRCLLDPVSYRILKGSIAGSKESVYHDEDVYYNSLYLSWLTDGMIIETVDEFTPLSVWQEDNLLAVVMPFKLK